ncbi:ubiquitin carboxyl-terminal hydrolase 6-like [Arachis stenosperma]|uniref:ubiquitin carboxyl-terminal hydrolase 6-like n=1 Tax=Arachis stenosperma TaxID=217475 RepID=UPI0025AC36CE|nr:ubiquitin carboxyl-terminal hydrolase 6-like [Arachis stenosperma]
MADAEGSSNGGGEPPVALMEEGEKVMQMTGIYDLVAVLTHKGRSADSGHYVGWVKQENDNVIMDWLQNISEKGDKRRDKKAKFSCEKSSDDEEKEAAERASEVNFADEISEINTGLPSPTSSINY